jgi:TRAP-type C4-dicarboxylate transport system substrate-binding protein
MIQPALVVARVSALPVRSSFLHYLNPRPKDHSMTSMPSIRFTRRTLDPGLAAALLALSSSAALAQDIQERTIKFGHLNNPDHPTSFGVKQVWRARGGQERRQDQGAGIPASQLGNEMQQQSALQGGVQEMSVASTTSLNGIVKEFGLLDFPFLFASFAQADALLDGPLGKMLIAKLPEKA